MWWSYVTGGVIFMLSFALGYLGAELVRALRRPRPVSNPYAKYFPEEHRHTRPPGWHP